MYGVKYVQILRQYTILVYYIFESRFIINHFIRTVRRFVP